MATDFAQLGETDGGEMKAVLYGQAQTLDWVSVSSSNVNAAAYAKDFHRLFLRFHGGHLVAYDGVTPALWQDFLSAPSKGKWKDRVLVKGGFAYTPVNY